MENKEKVLGAIQQTILNCDNKASSLITALGIVFGFSLFSIDEISKVSDLQQILAYIFGSLYLALFISTLIVLIFVVYPRGKKEKEKRFDYKFYSEDLYGRMSDDDFETFICAQNEDALLDQIKECVKIAHTKTKLLRISSFLLVGFIVLLVALIVTLAI